MRILALGTLALLAFAVTASAQMPPPGLDDPRVAPRIPSRACKLDSFVAPFLLLLPGTAGSNRFDVTGK
jgi:hypothetical protein